MLILAKFQGSARVSASHERIGWEDQLLSRRNLGSARALACSLRRPRRNFRT